MISATPPERHPRLRRGSLERPLNGNLYRTASLLVAIPLLLLAFTVSTPSPLPRPALPETFDTAAATALTRDLASDFPDRAPGTGGDAGSASWFAQQLKPYGLDLSTSSWLADVPGHGRVRLTNVMAAVGGLSPETILVVAHRDDLGYGPGANDNASGTAVLIELARAYAEPTGVGTSKARAVDSLHPVVFLSTDGGSYGGLGVRHFLATTQHISRIAAVINLDALAGSGDASLEIAGDRPRSPDPVLLATTAQRIAEQTGRAADHVGFVGQLIDLAFPFTLYDQGPFLAAGVPAITLTTATDRPPSPIGDGSVDTRRLGELGAASQELLGSLDQDVGLMPGTSSYIWVGGRTIRGWAVELVLIALLIPIAVSIVDLYALLRRNHIRLTAAIRRLRAGLYFWLFVGAVFTCFRLLGAWPGGPALPPNPANPLSTSWATAPLAGMLALIAIGWLATRPRVQPSTSSEDALAAHLVGLTTLFVVGLLVASTNPFALIFVLPALHAWLWLVQRRASGLVVRAFLFVLGFAGPIVLLGSLARRFNLGLNAPWYLLELAANGFVGPLATGLSLVFAAAACQVGAAAFGRRVPPGTNWQRRLERRKRQRSTLHASARQSALLAVALRARHYRTR